MKKQILTAALLLMAVIACNKAMDNPGKPQEKGAPISFTSNAQGGTKVTLDGLNLKWAAGDKIAVYSYKGAETTPTGKDLCDLSSGTGQSSGNFTPENAEFGTDWVKDGAASDAYTFYSWYPASAAPTGSSETVANVAASQEEGNLGDYLICWAQGNATKTRAQVITGVAPSFSFSPRVALLKVAIQNTSEASITVNSITVKTSSGYIAGDVTLGVMDGSVSAGTSARIDYTPASPIVVASNATSSVHTIALLPNEGTITIEVDDNQGGIFTISSNTTGAVAAGCCYTVTANVSKYKATPALAHDDADFVNGTYYYGEANCIVIPQGVQSESLDVSLYKVSGDASNHARGDMATDYRSAAVSAKVIWTEGMVLTPSLNWSGNQCTMTVTKSNASDTGNALVGLYDGENGTGNLLWSFHVWAPVDGGTTVPDVQDNPNEHYAKAYNLALGQIENAYDSYMYYQWGRKDPLGRSASITNQTNDLIVVSGGPSEEGAGVKAANKTGESVNNLDYARKNPTVFITRADNSTNTFDWYPVKDVNDASHRDNYLWNVVDGKGSIYDPCPKDYHVPAYNSLWYNDGNITGLSITSESNWAFQHRSIYYVYGGRRYGSDGSVDSVRSLGYYWASSPLANSRYAYSLYFNASYANPSYDNSRSYGHGVRCVQN